METQTLNEPTNYKQQFLNLLSAGILLISGFFISLFILFTSILLLPLALFKLNRFKKQFSQQFKQQQEGTMNSKSSQADETIIEGEYTVKEEKR